MKRVQKGLIYILIICMLMVLSSCGKEEAADSANVYVLTGPTGIGAVDLWNRSDKGETDVKYNFTAVASPDEIVAKISNGETDIAAISTNLAAKLYQKTDKNIKIIAVNTLGVLSVLDNNGNKIESLKDLVGKKIVTTGQGANPQYIIEYLLKSNGIDPLNDVVIEYRAEGSELLTVWATEPDAIIIAPSPVSTALVMNYQDSKKVLDLTEEWEKCSADSDLMMGCLIARKDFIEKNKDVVDTFIEDYKDSIASVLADKKSAGELCEQYGLVAKAAMAEKSIDDCHLCCITGNEMQTKLTAYLQVLYDADKSSVGAVPDEGIWY